MIDQSPSPSGIGQASAPIRRLTASQRPVFLVNSRLSLVCAPTRCRVGPLLPKLRGQLAEFLHEGSLARLSLLSSPTCVGLRYGPCFAPDGIFWASIPTRNARDGLPLRGPDGGKRVPRQSTLTRVTEYQPCVHRLRQTASA